MMLTFKLPVKSRLSFLSLLLLQQHSFLHHLLLCIHQRECGVTPWLLIMTSTCSCYILSSGWLMNFTSIFSSERSKHVPKVQGPCWLPQQSRDSPPSPAHCRYTHSPYCYNPGTGKLLHAVSTQWRAMTILIMSSRELSRMDSIVASLMADRVMSDLDSRWL